MKNRIATAVVLAGLASLAACSSLREYPTDWHRADHTVRVYTFGPSNMVELPVGGSVVTVLDAVFESKLEGDWSRVVVFRRNGSQTVKLDVNVLEMIKTGDCSKNLQLQPGDVVGIAG